ncbi:SUKH-4 family immunity protein [Kitasatospora gansuensis]
MGGGRGTGGDHARADASSAHVCRCAGGGGSDRSLAGAGRGLAPRAWESTSDAEQPSGSGPFHLLGEWMGAPLVLDGADGRVLRMLPPNSSEWAHPREPLAGSSLESFVTMVALQKQYLQVHGTGGPDRDDVLAELQLHLDGVDRAAAASDCWQYVLETDNWG